MLANPHSFVFCFTIFFLIFNGYSNFFLAVVNLSLHVLRKPKDLNIFSFLKSQLSYSQIDIVYICLTNSRIPTVFISLIPLHYYFFTIKRGMAILLYQISASIDIIRVLKEHKLLKK